MLYNFSMQNIGKNRAPENRAPEKKTAAARAAARAIDKELKEKQVGADMQRIALNAITEAQG